MANEEQNTQQEPKKKSKLGLILVLLVVVAGAGGGAWWFLLRKNVPKTEAAAEPVAVVKAVLHLESFIVNLADTEGTHYLRAGIDLGLEEPDKGGEGESGENVLNGPIRDTIMEVLSSRQSDSLLSTDGKAKLKEDLLAALKANVPELKVKKVYFTEFLVQR